MAEQHFPALNFSGQDLLFKKAAAAFLSKHSVDFQPVGDLQEEYQAVIKVRFGSNTTRASTAQDKELFKSTRANKDQSKILNKLKAMNSNNEIYNMVDEMSRLIEVSKTQSLNETQDRQNKNTADSDTKTSAKQKSRKLSVEKEKELQKNCEALGQILKVKDIIKKEHVKKANSSGLGSGKEKILDKGNFQQKKSLEKPKLKQKEQKDNEIKIWGEYSETRALNSSLNRNNEKGKSDKIASNLVVEQPKMLDVPSPNNVNNSPDPPLEMIEMKEDKDITNNPEESKNEQNEKSSPIALEPKVNPSPKNNVSLKLGSESERKVYNKSPKKSQGQPKIPIKYLSGEKMTGRPEFKTIKSPEKLEKQMPASARLPETGLDYSYEEKRINFTPKRSLNFEHLSSGERIEYHQVLVDQARYSPTYALAARQKSGPYLLKDSFSKLVTETEKKKPKH